MDKKIGEKWQRRHKFYESARQDIMPAEPVERLVLVTDFHQAVTAAVSLEIGREGQAGIDPNMAENVLSLALAQSIHELKSTGRMETALNVVPLGMVLEALEAEPMFGDLKPYVLRDVERKGVYRAAFIEAIDGLESVGTYKRNWRGNVAGVQMQPTEGALIAPMRP